MSQCPCKFGLSFGIVFKSGRNNTNVIQYLVGTLNGIIRFFMKALYIIVKNTGIAVINFSFGRAKLCTKELIPQQIVKLWNPSVRPFVGTNNGINRIE